MKKLYPLLMAIMLSMTAMAQYESYATLADLAQDKLHNSFRSSNGSYYIENSGTSHTYFHYWWNAHALDVLVDAWLRTNDGKYITRMNTLVNSWSSNNGGSLYNDYYDDMEWLALSLFRAYEATGDGNFLALSTNLWNDIKTGENSYQGGGIAWRKTQLDYKNTPANAPAIIYACRRHQKWGHSWELDLATNLYTWLKNTLREPSGRINDGINRTGNSSIDYWQFTYNYGTFIGAALEMYQSTDNATYLNDAIATADFAIQSTELSTNGIFRNEGDGDAALFKGILVRYLALLTQEPAVSVAKRNAYKAILEDQALSLHTHGFNRTHHTIGPDWAQTAGSSGWLSAQLSGIMMLEAAADLNFSAPVAPVVLFEHCFYGGYAVPLGVGSYTMGQLQALGIMNDQVSSVNVQSGYQATLYEHHDFTGNSLVLSSGDYSCLVDNGFNDEMSSLVITKLGARTAHRTISQEPEVFHTTFSPNPVNTGDLLRVRFGHNVEQAQVSLVDLTGRRVFHATIKASDGIASIPTKDLAPGTYILCLAENGGRISTSKVLVK